MSYLELLQSLYALTQQKKQIDNLDEMHTLLQKSGNPHLRYPTVLVGGSNGKGSVCLKIAETLRLSGYKVGIYCSPHLSCFRERIGINGEMITEQEFLHTYNSLCFSPTHSFFERTTATAFLYFAEQDVDIAVVEVGLGGRLDATNCIEPCLSVITSISLEHTEILGETVEEIAREKLGIARAYAPLVLGPTFPNIAIDSAVVVYRVEEVAHGYDVQNQAIARQGIELLRKSFSIPKEAEAGLLKRPACRLERIEPCYTLDVAHNPAGMRALRQSVSPDVVLLGLSRRKEAYLTLQAAQEFNVPIILFAGNHPRCLIEEELLTLSEGKLPIYGSFEKALEQVCGKQEVLVTGSCFIMAEVRKVLGIQDECDPFDLNEKALPALSRS